MNVKKTPVRMHEKTSACFKKNISIFFRKHQHIFFKYQHVFLHVCRMIENEAIICKKRK